MDLAEFFSPINQKEDLLFSEPEKDSWLSTVKIYDKQFPDLTNCKIAIIGVVTEEFKNEPNIIRSLLYSNKRKEYAKIIADLGNYYIEKYDNKTFEKLGYVLSEIIQKNVLPIIIGPSQEITYSQYLAFEYLKKVINLTIIDSRIDFQIEYEDKPGTESFLYRILLKDPSYLFNLSHIGYQSYFTESDTIKLFEKYHFDHIRLGKVRGNISELEPILRSSELVSFDISAIKQSDAPGTDHPSPNGLTADEACRITRYAGISDNLGSIAFYEYNSAFDNNFQTAQLISQMIWYFVDGFIHKNVEKVIGSKDKFFKYITTDNKKYQIIFYKSKKTNRWWMEIPAKEASKQFNGKNIIPCSYEDYKQATKGEIPERWWTALQKLI